MGRQQLYLGINLLGLPGNHLYRARAQSMFRVTENGIRMAYNHDARYAFGR